MPASGGDRAYRCRPARPAYLPTCDVRGRDLQRQPYVDSSRSASKIFYVETLATTIRAISGLSRQTPSARMTKSAGSKTCAFTKSSTAINFRPLRLHQIEHECRRAVPLIVHDPEHRIIGIDQSTYLHIVFAASAQSASGVSPLLPMK